MKFLTLMLAVLTATFGTALAADEDANPNFADYAVLAGISPFGGSFSFAHNSSEQTTWVFSIGGNADMNLDIEIESEDYELVSESSWVGFFINHRPLENAKWFRLVAGLGVGSIENDLERIDSRGIATNERYEANYKENPVGYLGVGFGLKPRKGFVWGVDIGWLQTAGPEIRGLTNDATVDGEEAIRASYLFGAPLLNLQVSLGYGF